MELVTIKQFAEGKKISYEAARRQVVRYANELTGHVIKKDRTQYLDSWAVQFLTERRRESPIILTTMDQNEENQRLKEEVDSLRVKLMTAQNELLREKDRVIELQEEVRKTLEDRARYSALLEDNKEKEEKLKEAGEQIVDLSRQVEEKDGQIETFQNEADTLRSKAEDYRRMVDDLSRERDEAKAEAQSFTRSIFGFYRKK